MSTVIKYKAFKNSEDFEEWQLKYTPKIIGVTAIINGLNGQNENDTVDMNARYGAYVTYYDCKGNISTYEKFLEAEIVKLKKKIKDLEESQSEQ